MIRNYPLLVGTYDPQHHCVINPNYLLNVLKWKTDILPNLPPNSFGTVIELTHLEEENVSVTKYFTSVFCLIIVQYYFWSSCFLLLDLIKMSSLEEQTLFRGSLFKEENKSWNLWSAEMKPNYKRLKGQVQEVTRRNAWQLHNYLHLCIVFISQGFQQCIWGFTSANIYIYIHT